MSKILKGLHESRSDWDSNMPGYQGDYGGAANWGRRNREDDEHHEIDAVLAARHAQRQEYERNGKFWLKLKDSQRHLPAGPFTGKQAANVAAVELLKQQPELKGNLLITAYGPDETQDVAEEQLDELSNNTLASYKKKAGADATQADKRGDYARGDKRMSGIVKATKKEFDNDAKGVAEGIPDVDHMHGPRGIGLDWADTRDLLQKPFEHYGNYKEWYRDVNRVNSELLDDNAEFSTMAGGKIISINGKDFAFWSNRNGNGSIDIGIAKKHSGQGVAEGSSESVSLRDMVNVVDQHYPKYYAELSGSDISDKQFERAIVNAYKKIMQKQGVAEGPSFDKWADDRAASQLYKLKPATEWTVSYDYGPHMTKTVTVKAGSEEEARDKVEKAAEKKGMSIMINSVEQGVAEGIMNTIANKVMGAAPEQPKYQVGQRVKYETSPHQPDWKDGGRGVGVITAYKNGHYMINDNPVNHFEIKGVVDQDVAEEKQRLDPSCWKGYKKQGTKMKGDTRVNNCVPVKESAIMKGLK